MILTKSDIEINLQKGDITLNPFVKEQLNPNSYNFRLGITIKILAISENDNSLNIIEKKIPKSGFLLEPNNLYLCNTYETIGSSKYAISLIGRSSIGRLGLFIQCSANLGHTGTSHNWTLELIPTQPIIIYPKMIIGQVSFWKNCGNLIPYSGYYGQFNNIQESSQGLT